MKLFNNCDLIIVNIFSLKLTLFQTLEHVVVDCKLNALPPTLSEAIKAISKWRFIEACLPHVMHSSALYLTNRNLFGS